MNDDETKTELRNQLNVWVLRVMRKRICEEGKQEKK